MKRSFVIIIILVLSLLMTGCAPASEQQQTLQAEKEVIQFQCVDVVL